MNTVADSSNVRYAVIAGLRTETGHERLVIAYPNEESLRDLIAAPSIIAFGFSSREEAVMDSRASVPPAVAYRRMPEPRAGKEIESDERELDWDGRRGETDSRLRGLFNFFATSYSNIAAMVIALFFSRNAVSSAIRMALGSSV